MVSLTYQQLICELTAEMQVQQSQSSTTGIFNDNTDTYSAATTDAINYQIVTASAGTSMKVAFIVVWENSAVQVTPATIYKHFRNVPPMKPPFTPNLDMGNQYVTFG